MTKKDGTEEEGGKGKKREEKGEKEKREISVDFPFSFFFPFSSFICSGQSRSNSKTSARDGESVIMQQR